MARGGFRPAAFPWDTVRDDRRREKAVAFLEAGDRAAIWALFQAHITLRGRSGATTSKHTLKAYKAGMTAYWDYLQDHLGLAGDALVTYLEAGNTDAASRYIGYLQDQDLKATTVNNRRASTRAFYRALKWAHVTSEDPFDNLPSVRDPIARHEKRQPYEQAEVDAMLASATNPYDHALILLGAQGGLRISEMANLTWKDVNLKTGKLLITGKGRKVARVSIPQGLRDALTKLEPKEGKVLPWTRTQTLRDHIRRLTEQAGVEYKGVHSLRHYCGTYIYGKTQNLDAAARHLRHSQIETTRVYAKWNDGMMKGVLDGWGG